MIGNSHLIVWRLECEYWRSRTMFDELAIAYSGCIDLEDSKTRSGLVIFSMQLAYASPQVDVEQTVIMIITVCMPGFNNDCNSRREQD